MPAIREPRSCHNYQVFGRSLVVLASIVSRETDLVEIPGPSLLRVARNRVVV